MEPHHLSLAFMLWLLGLVTLPLWLYPIGRRSARARERREAPHRHPRPAIDVSASAPAASADEATPAFADGIAATAGARPRRARHIPRLLEARHGIAGEVVELPDPDTLYHVSLVRGVGGHASVGGVACAYDRGVLAGLFAKLLGGPVEVEESECAAYGAPLCRFDVRLAGSEARAPRPLRARLASRLLRWQETVLPARRRATRAASADQPSSQSSRRR